MTTERKQPQEHVIKHTVIMNTHELELRDEALTQIQQLRETLPLTDYTPPWSKSSKGSHTALLSFFETYEGLLNNNQVDIYSDLQQIITLVTCLNNDIKARGENNNRLFEQAKYRLNEFLCSREAATKLDKFKDLIDREAKNSPFFDLCQTVYSDCTKLLKTNSLNDEILNAFDYAHELLKLKDDHLSEFKSIFFKYRFSNSLQASISLNKRVADLFDRASRRYIGAKTPQTLNDYLPALKLGIKLIQLQPSTTINRYIQEFLKYRNFNSMNFISESQATEFNKFVILMFNTLPKNGDGKESKSSDENPNLSFDDMEFFANSSKVNEGCFKTINDALEKGDDWGSEKKLVNGDIQKIIAYFKEESREVKEQVSEEFYDPYFEYLKKNISCKEFQFNLMRSVLLERNSNSLLAISATTYLSKLAAEKSMSWATKIDVLIQLSSIFSDLRTFQNNNRGLGRDAQSLGEKVYSDTCSRINDNLALNKIDKNDITLLSNLIIVTDVYKEHDERMTAYRQLESIILPGKGSPSRERAGLILQYAALAVGVLAPAAIFVASGGSACLGLQIGIAVTALLIIGIGECIKRFSRDTGAAKNLFAWLPKIALQIAEDNPDPSRAAAERKR